MADLEHSNIADPNIHEPKGVAAASADEVYLSDGLGSGAWTNATRITGGGWCYYADSTYTGATELDIAATASPGTQITIDKVAANNETYAPLDMASPLWDAATNKIVPIALGDSYDIQLDFTISSTAVAAYLVFELDTGGGTPNTTIERTIYFPKGVGSKVSISFSAFCLADFIANGGKLRLYKDAGTVKIQDIDIFIKRDFKA